MFSMLEYQREVCGWKRDDLWESEGGGYQVEGEGGRGGVEGGERWGEGEREGFNSLGVYDHMTRGREKARVCCAPSSSCCKSVRRYLPVLDMKSITGLLSPLMIILLGVWAGKCRPARSTACAAPAASA